MKANLIKEIDKNKIIIIVRDVKSKNLIPLAEALYNGGIRLMEITYSADGHISDEDTANDLKMLKNHFGDRMHFGSGTVLNEKQVELTKKAGGEFIVSPDTNESVIRKTCELNMVSIPGAMTPSEITFAHRCGADFVKLYPADCLGLKYIKSIKAPLSNIKLLAVGGVRDDEIADYLSVGVCGFAIGGNIVNKKLIEGGNFEAITELAKKHVLAAGVEN